MSLYFIFVK